MKPRTEMLEAKDATMLVFSKKKGLLANFPQNISRSPKKSLRAKSRKFLDEEKQIMTLARF